MFDSASTILNHYIKIKNRQLWRFDIYSIQTQRGENPEDQYYLCNVRNSWYIVFETDYIFSLTEAAKEAADIFELDDLKITHWVTKRDENGKEGVLSLEVAAGKAHYDKLVLDIEGTYLRCAVLAAEMKGEAQRRYDPMVYGSSI